MWIQSLRGRAIDLLEPKADDIDPTELAILMGRLGRFGNHTRQPYTVAEHCVRVSHLLREKRCVAVTQLAGLLHDAHEGYMGCDITSPLMEAVGAAARERIKEIQRGFDRAIAERFGFSHHEFTDQAVKLADRVLLATERRDLMAPPPRTWQPLPDPHPERIVPLMEPGSAFGAILHELTGERVGIDLIRESKWSAEPIEAAV